MTLLTLLLLSRHSTTLLLPSSKKPPQTKKAGKTHFLQKRKYGVHIKRTALPNMSYKFIPYCFYFRHLLSRAYCNFSTDGTLAPVLSYTCFTERKLCADCFSACRYMHQQTKLLKEETMDSSNRAAGQTIDDGVCAYQATKGAILLDVRTPQEYRDGHIPTSINLPLQNIANIKEVVPNKETPLFVYCKSGMRSEHAASILKQN